MQHEARRHNTKHEKKPNTNPARPDETWARAARSAAQAALELIPSPWASTAQHEKWREARQQTEAASPPPHNGYSPPPAQRPFWPIISPHSAPPFIYKGHAAAAGRPISSPNPNRLIHSTPPAAQRPHCSRLRLAFAAPPSPRRPTSSTPVTLICLTPPASLSIPSPP